MAYTDNMEYIIRGGWDEASQSYTGCVTPNDGVISECRVRELVEVFSATEEELKTAYERCRWEDIRIERDRLIAETDYMALQDTSELSDEWKTYRQALRDLPSQSDFPRSVTFPTKPS